MERSIIFVESNTSGTGYMLATIAYRRGFKPLLITNDIPRYNFENYVDFHIVDTNNYNSVRDKVVELKEVYDVKGITSTSDYYMEMVARLTEEFNYPSASLDTIMLCRNKYNFRKHMKKNAFLSPNFMLIQNEENLKKVINEQTMSFPFIVKPVQGSGSIGVKLIYEKEELKSHSLKLLNKKTNERGQKVDNSVLLEEFIVGEEFSLELFDGALVGVTKKYKSDLPYFIELGHDFPYQLDEKFMIQITQLVKRLKTSFDLSWGPYHIEFIKTEEFLFVVEINPRLAGGYIPILMEESLEIDLLEMCLNNIIGEQNKLNFIPKKYASIRFIISEKTGEIKENIESIDIHDYISKVQIKSYSKDLSNYSRNFDFRDRIGHVIATHKEISIVINEVDHLYKKAQKSLK